MTLDEAIEKCTELSRRHADTEAGREFGQMAGWLREYRAMLAKGAAGSRRRPGSVQEPEELFMEEECKNAKGGEKYEQD